MDLEARAAHHAAVGDPIRLAIVDELLRSDRSPSELGDLVGLPSNLLAHHLGVLEDAGIISRVTSSGDRRRRYIRADVAVAASLGLGAEATGTGNVLFVCTHNSARSQLAAALWTEATGTPALSAGTHPAERVQPGAIAAAGRVGIDLGGARPRSIDELPPEPSTQVVTVCDRAHEELPAPTEWWHWSIPDPATEDSPAAYDRALEMIADRISTITGGSPWN